MTNNTVMVHLVRKIPETKLLLRVRGTKMQIRINRYQIALAIMETSKSINLINLRMI